MSRSLAFASIVASSSTSEKLQRDTMAKIERNDKIIKANLGKTTPNLSEALASGFKIQNYTKELSHAIDEMLIKENKNTYKFYQKRRIKRFCERKNERNSRDRFRNKRNYSNKKQNNTFFTKKKRRV
ncbi:MULTISPECIES: hypothetical protein [unclassified Campylobacter]|uniref:hypothetical protein n=1 Tax=unclassified Campylobacter TaxID=2593542 RepID=UPI0022E99786|nr:MULTISPECIES: hypothetical protein [unclassified Campylobacter]MDA3061638.1 hypothetical protein [Campylobacter sp. JMF_14 EL1]MDA3073256.1 hypothetical protein [Campylobacter sp. JMF_10 EL2]